MRITVDLDGLTWDELGAFADAGRDAGLSGAAVVEVDVSRSDDLMPVALVAEVGTAKNRSIAINHWDRLKFAASLAAVIDSEGDARGVLGELRNLRDQLLGADELD